LFLSVCVQVYTAIFDASFLIANWFFIVYPLHYLLLGMAMLLTAAGGSKRLRQIPEVVIGDLASGAAVLSGDTRLFASYLRCTSHHIEILRIPMTYGSMRAIVSLLIAALIAILQMFFREIAGTTTC